MINRPQSIVEIEQSVQVYPGLPQKLEGLRQSKVSNESELRNQQEQYDVLQVTYLPRLIPNLKQQLIPPRNAMSVLNPQLQAKSLELNLTIKRVTELQGYKRGLEHNITQSQNLIEQNRSSQLSIAENSRLISENDRRITNLSLMSTTHVDVIPHGNHAHLAVHEATPLIQTPLHYHRGLQQSVYSSSYGQMSHHNSPSSMPYSHQPNLNFSMIEIEELRRKNENLQRSNQRMSEQISRNQALINQFQARLTIQDMEYGICNLEMVINKLAEKVQIQNRIQSEFDALNKQMSDLQAAVTQLEAMIRHSEAELSRCQRQHKAIPDHGLESTEILQAKSTRLWGEIDQLQKTIKIQQEAIRQEEALKIKLLNNLLVTNPAQALNDFAQKIIAKFQQFELEHSVNQSIHVRRCLLLFVEKIEAIQRDKKDDAQLREAYYQLCGMLAYFQESVKDTLNPKDPPAIKKSNKVFKEMLHTLGTEGVYVDDAQCIKRYKQLITQRIFGIGELTLDQLYVEEKRVYETARGNLKATLSQISNDDVLRNQVDQLLNDSELKLNSLTPEAQKKQYHFFSIILARVRNAVTSNITQRDDTNPQNKVASLAALASLQKVNLPGAPSFWKKFIGVTLIILGTLLTTACALATKLSLFALAPYAVPGMCAGGSMVATGAAFFYSGREKSLARDVANLNKEIVKVDKTLSSAPPSYRA